VSIYIPAVVKSDPLMVPALLRLPADVVNRRKQTIVLTIAWGGRLYERNNNKTTRLKWNTNLALAGGNYEGRARARERRRVRIPKG